MHTLIVIIVIVAYFAAAACVARLDAITQEPKSDRYLLLHVPFAPAYLVGLVLMGLVLTPFWWLYPERHAHIYDLEGTESEQRRLAEYRAVLRRKPLWRRLAEKLRLAEKTGPPYPWPDEDVA